MYFSQDFLMSVLPKSSIISGKIVQGIKFAVDSRNLKKDEIFIALEGENVDGHLFLAQALQKGAGVMIAEKNKYLINSLISQFSDKCIILVVNPYQALIDLASAWRSQLKADIVGITGSLGKTSTKEYTAAFLRGAGKKCFASQGNQNTLIGIALNILQMDDSYEIGVFEVGIGKTFEMDAIVTLLRPTTAVITYIGNSHVEGLGSLASIAMEKRKIFSQFSEKNIGIINGDQKIISSVGYPFPVIRFGQKTSNQIQARKIKITEDSINFVLKIYNEKYNITLPITHEGVIYNILAASAVAYLFGVDQKAIIISIKNLPCVAQRFEVCPLKDKRGIMIDDCYNASPESMQAALTAFDYMKCTGKKIAVLGDMLELGENSTFFHKKVGRFFTKSNSINHIILVGDNMKTIKEVIPHRVSYELVDNWRDAIEHLKSFIEDDNAILVKGSRGMELQNIVSTFAYKKQVNANV